MEPNKPGKPGRPRKIIIPESVEEATTVPVTNQPPVVPQAPVIPEPDTNTAHTTAAEGADEDFQMPKEEELTSSLSADFIEANDDIPDFDPDPTKEKVIDRGYTTGAAKPDATIDPTKPEPVIPEPPLKAPPSNANDIIGDVKADFGNMGGGNSGGGGKTGGGAGPYSGGSSSGGGNTGGSGAPKRPNPNPKFDDLSPKQKRDNAEKAADALLLSYSQVVPIPFKWASKFNMRKLERMEMDDLIDMQDDLDGDGTTIESYAKDINNQAEQIFVVTDQMRAELKDPLVDVLMENNLALTPTQRLMMALGGQLLQFGITAGQFYMQNRSALEFFKEKHKDNKGALRPPRQGPPPPPPQAPPPPPPPPPPAPSPAPGTPPKKTTPPSAGNDMDNYMDTEPVNFEAEPASNLDDFLKKDKEEEVLSVENGGLTIEEFIDTPGLKEDNEDIPQDEF